MECKKCKTDTEIPGKSFFHDKERVYLCGYCSQVLDQIGTEKLNDYLNDKKLDLIKNQITRNIIQARIKRNVSEQNEIN